LAEKKSLWKKIFAPEPLEFTCPHCSGQVKENAERCETCGSRFRIESVTHWDNTREIVWPSGLPEIESLPIAETKYAETFPEEPAKHGLSREKFDEMLSAASVNLPVPSSTLLSRLLKDYEGFFDWLGRNNYVTKEELTLEQWLYFFASKIPKNATTYAQVLETVKNIISSARKTSLKRRNHYFIDARSGSGWLPLYDRVVSIEPVRVLLATIGGSLIHDIWVETNEPSGSDSSCCFNIALSNKDDITPSQMERLWSSLREISEPVIFEIVSSGKAQKIIFQILCGSSDKARIGNRLSTIFPNSSINPEGDDQDYLLGQFESDWSDYQAFGAAFGLARHYSYPLRTLTSFDKTDPLSSIMTSLSAFGKDEGAVIQALVCPSTNSWVKQLERVRELATEHNWDDFKDCPVQQKLTYPLFAVCLRVMAFGKKGVANTEKLKSFPAAILNALSSFSSPKGNSISAKILERDTSARVPQATSKLNERQFLSVLERNTYRHGFILNTQELASLLHFPSKALQHPKLLRQESAVAKAPEAVTAGGLPIGVNEVFGQSQEVYVPEDFRFRHIYVVGKTGTGKTTLLLNMIKSDVDAGKGVGLIDPHGDLVEKVLSVIPEERIDDVILFDPTDYEFPIGFNMFQVSDHIERRQMRGDIVVAIKRLFESSAWGDNIDQLFRTSVATLLADSGQEHTLLDIRKLISDDVFRSQALRRIDDEYLQEFWTEDFPSFTRSTISAVKRRLASVLGEPEVRGILGQSQTGFNFREMMDTKKIFLANLSRGKLGENISGLFGGLLVSKIQLTAMARASQPEEERVPFYLYVDEFQNFVSESFEIILSEARKYKLCLTIAHQFTGQLPSRLYDAVFGNVGTLIVFEVGVDDATALEKQLGKFSKDDVINLERFHTFTRIGKARETFSMATLPPGEVETDFSDRVRQASREKYCAALQSEPKQQVQAVKREQKEPQVESPQTGGFFEPLAEEAESGQQDVKSERTDKLEDTTPEGQTDEIEFFERTTDE